ncbi:MAG: DivIVA domain-containing protein [Mollicutes bacterium]|nr:MAG: DivIVA domain-containing protein [Mollicutes bacterium]
MMKIEIDLTSEDILEKRFTINLKGYDVKEVDYFLDLIKKDYEM